MMHVRRYDRADEFLQAAGPFLEAEEAANSMILGLAAAIAAGQRTYDLPPVMMTVGGGHGLEAAMLMTAPPRYALLYAPGRSSGQALGGVVDALLSDGDEVRGCMAPTATARTFAALWTERTGQEVGPEMGQRIYEVRKVLPPAAVSGRLRAATMGELDLAADWRRRFLLEALPEDDPAGARAQAEQSIRRGYLFFWDDAGRPVCQAATARRTWHGVSIRAVYTPPDLRRRGYATVCVAALSQQQLQAGRQFCCLYTDLANPTSNSIYQKIGYVPVVDVGRYRFAEAGHS